MDRLVLDIETRSRVNLKTAGVYRYVTCPDFEILMCAWSLNGSPVRVAVGEAEIHETPGLLHADVLHVAHNAAFERVCFSAFVGLPAGSYLSPENWHDTASVASENGLPRSLAGVAHALHCAPKDSAGTRLVNFFCKPRANGEFNRPEDHPERWQAFIDYCAQDVETLLEVDEKLGDWPVESERRVYMVDQRINDRGMGIDVPLARRAMQAAQDNATAQTARVIELSGVENPNSVAQMRRWLESEGIPEDNLRAATVERMLKGDLSPVQREVLELRQELALAAPKKFASALDQQVDGRLRGNLNFFGAHTGRWAGRGTQPHNLPRLAFDNPADEALCIADLMAGEEVSTEDLKRVVRPMFVEAEGLTVVDYSAIEARVLAWLAGESWALQAFREGRCIYTETGARMGGLGRSQGKVATLALGYAGGAGSLRAMDFRGDFSALSDKQLVSMYVRPWRRANARIVKLWSLLDDVFGDGGAAGDHLRVRSSRGPTGRVSRIVLPSGRSLNYQDVRWERYFIVDPETGKRVFKEGWRYQNPAKPGRLGTYGGKLAENVTQAVARDILAEALVRLEERGFEVVAHVHDEVLIRGKHDVGLISEIMCELPEWAQDLPIDSEGDTVDRYRKL